MTQTLIALNQQTIAVEHSDAIDGDKISSALRSAQTALLQAAVNTTKAGAFASVRGYIPSLAPGYIDLLRTSFNLPPPDAADAIRVYPPALRRILDTIALINEGLRADRVEVADIEASVLAQNPTAHGYVAKNFKEAIAQGLRSYGHDLSAVKPLANPVVLKLADKAELLAWYWVHEASHKFALTVDADSGGQTAYFDGIDRCAERTRLRATCELLREAGSPKTVEEMMQDDAFTKKMKPFTSLQLLDNADSYAHYIMLQPAKIT